MARVQTSGIINDISGKLSGSVFQRNQGGLIIRSQGGKINSNTQRSNLHKVNTATVQGYWQSLSDADRTLWQTFALFLKKKQKRNPSLIINGHQLFININSIRLDLAPYNFILSPAILSSPLLVSPPLPIQVTSIENSAGALLVNLDRTTDTGEDVVILFLSRPLTGSQLSGNVKMTLMKTATENDSLITCTFYYTQVYGRVPNTGEWIQSKIAVYSLTKQNYSSFSVGRFQVT